MANPIVFLDDADAFVAFDVTDRDGQNVDWASPQIAIGGGSYLSAAWQGSPAPTREIRLAMPNGLSLAEGVHSVVLKVPNGNDFTLGAVYVTSRS